MMRRGCSWCVLGYRVSTHSEPLHQNASRIRANVGFAELSTNLSGELTQTAVPVLLEILSDIPFIECANNLTWDGAFYV